MPRFTNEQNLIFKIADAEIVTDCVAVNDSYEDENKKEVCDIKISCSVLGLDYDPILTKVSVDLLDDAPSE